MTKVYLVRGFDPTDRDCSWWTVFGSIDEAVSETTSSMGDEDLEQPISEGVVVYEATPKLIGSFKMKSSAVKVKVKK